MIIKTTEYLPAYNYMEEIYCTYDLDNHIYKVNNGEWKPLRKSQEDYIKKVYKVS